MSKPSGGSPAAKPRATDAARPSTLSSLQLCRSRKAVPENDAWQMGRDLPSWKKKRIGTVLGPSHSDVALRKQVLDLLRFTYNEIVEYHGLRGIPSSSLAEEDREHSGEPSALAEGAESSGKEKKEKRPAESTKVDKKAKKESEKPKKKRSEKPRSEERRSRSRRGSKGDRRPSPEKASSRRPRKKKEEDRVEPTAVKEEPSPEETEKSPVQSVEREDSPEPSAPSRSDKAESAPASGRVPRPPPYPPAGRPESKARARTPPQSRSRSPSAHQPPPGRWTLTERPKTRPAEPALPPRTPHQPPGPPPGWRGGSGQWHPQRSKGVNRRKRNEDIYFFGPSADRKKLREDQRRVRRPSGEEAPDTPEGGERAEEIGTAEEEYLRGNVVEARAVPAGRYKKGDWLLVSEGCYYKQSAAVAVKVEKEEFEEGEREVIGELTGTKNEDLLKHGTAQRPCRIRLHLCRASCPQLRENPDLVHVRHLRRLRPEEAKSWETNLLEHQETQLLAADEAAWRRAEEEKQKKEGARRSTSSSSRKKRKKKKKKKRKERRKEDAEKGEEKSPAKLRLGGKAVARKSLEALYAGTGLDPSPGHRKKLTKKVRRTLRRSRESSSSSTTSTSTTTSEDLEDDMLLSDRSRVHRIASLAPGILAAQSVTQMKPFVVQAGGSGWDLDLKTLPPIMTQYTRSHVASRVSGGVAREFCTLAWIGDLLLQARPAEALDTVCQRMKSIEMTTAGTAWSTSQKIELVPTLEASMSSRQEAQLAKKEAKLDMDVKGANAAQEKGTEEDGLRSTQRPFSEDEKLEETFASPLERIEKIAPGSEKTVRREEAQKSRGDAGGDRKLEEGVGCSRRGKARLHRDQRKKIKQVKKLFRRQGLLRKARWAWLEKVRQGNLALGEGSLLSNSIKKPAPAATGAGVSPSTEGPQGPATGDRLGVGQFVLEKSSEFLGKESGISLGSIMNWLDVKVGDFLGRLCKTTTTGRVFPLPSSPSLLGQLFPLNSPLERSILRVLVWSLNSLNGEGTEGTAKPSEFQKSVMRGLMEDCERVASWRCEDHIPSWSEFFKVKGVDYRGEEVLTAQSMSWRNVSPALPQEVGSVPLEDVVELGCRHYVLNFEDYLLEPEDQEYCKPPRVLVPPEDWEEFCSQLLGLGVFSRVHEDDIYKVRDRPLLNGLFGASKHEFEGTTEIMRIIMNLIPLNGVVRSIDGDISTLPSWAGMAPLHLQPHEDLLVSSEDVRAFFYIFKVPLDWHPFLAFNRPLPDSLKGEKPGRWYPCSAVLPMGFKNSVSLAQHVHRYVVKQALTRLNLQGGEAELRKDRAFSRANPLHRIYLDNFDELERTSKEVADTIRGKPSALVQGLQEVYAEWGIPRHPKKGVARQPQAEVQGAIVDGQLGIAYPKVEKVLRYAHLARLLIEKGTSSQRQMQIVGGGLVYIAMFRRPLLGSLNHVWQFIVDCNGYPPVVQFALPKEVVQELSRFLGLLPLAYMNFRNEISPMVTASDASQFGGGVTASEGLTPWGVTASSCQVRGDVVEPCEVTGVLTIGLFDGIGALRVAADALGWNVHGHVSVEKSAEANRVVESHFPGTIMAPDVAMVDLAMVKQWSQRFTQVSLVVLGAGPPCQGVSGLNAARKGALRDERSSLFSHVARIKGLVQKCFPWAQVQALMESVASMNATDEQVMSASFGTQPWRIDAAGVSLAHRPRLYWVDWELLEAPGVEFSHTPSGRANVSLSATLDCSRFVQQGWDKVENSPFPTFTTSRPRSTPGYKPAGIQQVSPSERKRWEEDSFRFPPYQYQDKHCLQNRKGEKRLPSIQEREVIMGFPKDYTQNCFKKNEQSSQQHVDARLTLVGNSWNVTVVAWLLSQLGAIRGLNPSFTVQELVERTSPGCTKDLATYLHRLPLHSTKKKSSHAEAKLLVSKLLTLVSMKGEDICLQTASDDLVKFHRLRASIPAKLWRWKTIAGWRWTGAKEHINVLEMRAVLTALRWRLERHHKLQVKFVHLVDSLVVLHALSRGRKGRTEGSNVLAAVQDTQPHLKGKLKLSWRLMKTWVSHEIPNRAPPLSVDGLHLLVGYSLFKGEALFALSLLLGFHALLRTGELLALKARDVAVQSPKGPAVISLGLTKAGKRQGAAESVTVHSEDVCRRLFQWKNQVRSDASLTGKAHAWRKHFSAVLTAVGLDQFDYRPYSLRRGGATHYFQLHGRFDSLLILGRWQSASTARIYINEGLSDIQSFMGQENWRQRIRKENAHAPKSAQFSVRNACRTLDVPKKPCQVHPRGAAIQTASLSMEDSRSFARSYAPNEQFLWPETAQHNVGWLIEDPQEGRRAIPVNERTTILGPSHLGFGWRRRSAEKRQECCESVLPRQVATPSTAPSSWGTQIF
eukprot:s824_g4.t1